MMFIWKYEFSWYLFDKMKCSFSGLTYQVSLVQLVTDK